MNMDENKKYKRVILVLFCLVAIGITYYVLFTYPYPGVADQGDFQRVMDVCRLTRTHYDNYILNHIGYYKYTTSDYLIMPYTLYNIGLTIISTSMGYFITFINLICQLFGSDIFKSNYLAILYAVIYIVSMVIILKNFNIKSKFKFTVLAILGLFVFLDGNYLVFFNSLYGEPMMITTLMLLIASYLHYIYKKHVMKNDKHVFINIIFVYISAWLFIGSKMQVLSALPVIMFILGKIIWNNRKIVGKKKFIVLIIAFILIVAYSIGINLRHVDIGDDTHYNSVFTGILENASSKEQKEQALIDLGLNPKMEVNSGTNSYQAIDDYKDGFIPHTEYMDEVFYSKMSNSKLAIYYLTHFSSLMKGMEYTATMALNTSNNLGKYSYSYSKEPIGKFNRFTYWSDLKTYLPKNLLFIVGSFALIFIISIFEYIKNKKSYYIKNKIQFLWCLMLIAILQFPMPFVGNGRCDTSKQLYLFNFIFDILIVIAIYWIVSKIFNLIFLKKKTKMSKD